MGGTKALAGALMGTLAALTLLTGCTSTPPARPDAAGPLSAYLWEFTERALARDKARALAAEEQVAACMKAQGFDYVPNPAGAWSSTLVTVPDEVGTPDWAAQHGYGIVDGANVSMGESAPPDPNAATLARMSAAELAAWNAALRGNPAAAANGDPAGCTGDAAQPYVQDEAYLHWQQEAGALEASADDDPGYVAALTAWVDCMATAGQAGLATPSDARQSIQSRADALGGPSAVIAEPQRSQLLAEEIALATADARCDASSGLSATRAQLVERLQTAFVEQQRAELDAWRETWATP